MAKEFYDISYKAYFNTRLKEVVFQGVETWPLYVQVTYDRKSVFFKSYYFGLFSQPKYDFLKMPLWHVIELEHKAIEFLIAWNADGFSLGRLQQQYKMHSQDLLDSLDRPFKKWLAGYFREQGLPGLSALMEHEPDRVAAIRLWDDLAKCLDADVFARLEMKVTRGEAPPYIHLAMYVRDKLPKGPFCLPLYEWSDDDTKRAIGRSIESRLWRADIGRIEMIVRGLLRSKG
ncbi:MAG TPA: hypothetical protein VNS58_06720 [Puia sp.]|nr:hypothetical protein [Puia sp.]